MSYFVIDLRDGKIAQMKTKKEVENELHSIFEGTFRYSIQAVNAENLMVIKGTKCDIINYDLSIKEVGK